MAIDPGPEVLAVVRSSPLDENNGFPPSASLFFPPFPPKPAGAAVTPFIEWGSQGVFIPVNTILGTQRTTLNDPSNPPDDNNPDVPMPHDALGVPLVDLASSTEAGINRTGKESQGKFRVTMRIKSEDCWKIGEIDSGWIEPEWACRQIFDLCLPPFTRLLNATREFLISRREEFLYHRNKFLFDLLRRSLGIDGNYVGAHWPGVGPDAYEYVPPSRVRKGFGIESLPDPALSSPKSFKDDAGKPSARQEVCVLLRCPEISIRGFLALARREAEAGWDFAPAFKLAKITAAFLSYLIHWEVLPDPNIAPQMLRAVALARSAPKMLLEAKVLEDAITNVRGWNRSVWTIWGGTYGSREVPNLHSNKGPAHPDENTTVAFDSDSAGWLVDMPSRAAEQKLSAEDVLETVSPLLLPLKPLELSLLNYIPYSRRIVTAVLPPLSSDATRPVYTYTLHRVVTRPAPWSEEERWRTPRETTNRESDDPGSDADEPGGPAFLEKERATMEEPGELVFWVEPAAVSEQGGKPMIGMGLRGRWAMVGKRDGSEYERWWVFKDKDYVLPAFWRSASAALT